MHNKPAAALSMDLDNAWSYLRTHGDEAWRSYPNYLPAVVPLVLDLLKKKGLKITFFIVGRDAAMEENRDVLKEIVSAGHEVGNHSYNHEPWLHRYPKNQIRREIRMAEEAISSIYGRRTIGYRAPGYGISLRLLEVLSEHGFAYDSSSLPTYLGPLARAYYYQRSCLSHKEMIKRMDLFGNFRYGRLPLDPYINSFPSGKRIVEIPITTIPFFRMPFHLSYLLYLSGISLLLMLYYFGFALALCRMTKTNVNFLFHPLDFIDLSDAPQLAFFPGMGMSRSRKRDKFHRIISRLSKHFELISLEDYARSISF